MKRFRCRWMFLVLLTVLTLAGCGRGGSERPAGGDDSAVQTPQAPLAALPLLSPARLAAMADGRILVSDPARRAVAIVDPSSGTPETWLTVGGAPLGVAELGGEILVGDEAGGSISRYGADGQLRGSLGGLTFASVSDLAVDIDAGKLFVLDARAAEVSVLDPTGLRLASFGSGQLQYPAGIAIDPSGERIFVSDLGGFSSVSGFTPKIQIFNYQGTPLGRLGTGLARPQGLAYLDGELFVVDSLHGIVQVYAVSGGQLLATLGGHGSAAGSLMLPLDLVAGLDVGTVYVGSNRTARIEALNYGGTP